MKKLVVRAWICICFTICFMALPKIYSMDQATSTEEEIQMGTEKQPDLENTLVIGFTLENNEIVPHIIQQNGNVQALLQTIAQKTPDQHQATTLQSLQLKLADCMDPQNPKKTNPIWKSIYKVTCDIVILLLQAGLIITKTVFGIIFTAIKEIYDGNLNQMHLEHSHFSISDLSSSDSGISIIKNEY